MEHKQNEMKKMTRYSRSAALQTGKDESDMEKTINRKVTSLQ